MPLGSECSSAMLLLRNNRQPQGKTRDHGILLPQRLAFMEADMHPVRALARETCAAHAGWQGVSLIR
jgi:hypothetical protein